MRLDSKLYGALWRSFESKPGTQFRNTLWGLFGRKLRRTCVAKLYTVRLEDV